MQLISLYTESLIYVLLTFIVVKEIQCISQWFIVDVYSTLGTLCCVDVGSVVDIPDVHAASIFRVLVEQIRGGRTENFYPVQTSMISGQGKLLNVLLEGHKMHEKTLSDRCSRMVTHRSPHQTDCLT